MDSPLSKRGFTLTELLVVISIIAVLSALLVPVVNNAITSSYQAATTASLHNIGTAIVSYGNDNNQMFPGPFSTGINAWYYRGDGSIGCLLWSYMNGDPPTNRLLALKGINNPGNLRYRQNSNSWVYVLNTWINPPGIKPFGYAGTATPPASMLTVLRYSPQTTMAMQDVDQQSSQAQGAPEYPTLPKTPVNGNVRMTLYLDWHVAPVPATNYAN